MNTYAPLNQVIKVSVEKELFGKSPSTQANFIVENLKNYMAKGLLPVNSKLNIQLLKKKYAVSTGVIQTAVANLIDARYAYRGSKGIFVAGLSLEELQEILSLRLILEKEALKVSIENGDDDWESSIVQACYSLAKLEEKIISERLDGDINILKEWSNLYKDFHLRLSLSSKSNISVQFITALYDQCEKYFISSLLRHDLSLKDISGHHEALKDAVLARDIKVATSILSNHAEKLYQGIEACIGVRHLN
jgi:GntR family transcriptional regulator, carbon starvation induced regulator